MSFRNTVIVQSTLACLLFSDCRSSQGGVLDPVNLSERRINVILEKGRPGARAVIHELQMQNKEPGAAGMLADAEWLLQDGIEIVDPMAHVAYTHEYLPASAAFIPNGGVNPILPALEQLRRQASEFPDGAADLSDLIWFTCLSHLADAARKGEPIGLADDVLYSRHLRPTGNRPEGLNAPPPQQRMVSDPKSLERISDARFWFVIRELYRVEKQPYFCAGMWHHAANVARQIDPESPNRWEPSLLRLARKLTSSHRYTSAAAVCHFGTSVTAFGLLADVAEAVPGGNVRATQNFAIAFAYAAENFNLRNDQGLGDLPAEAIAGTAFEKAATAVARLSSEVHLKTVSDVAQFDLATFRNTRATEIIKP